MIKRIRRHEHARVRSNLQRNVILPIGVMRTVPQSCLSGNKMNNRIRLILLTSLLYAGLTACSGSDSRGNAPVLNDNSSSSDLFGKQGVWEGDGSQVGGQWTIRIELTTENYLIEYPSLDCGGTLTLLESSENRLLFREGITFGSGCVDDGFVELVDDTIDTLNFNWYFNQGDLDNNDLGGWGSVTRVSF